MIYARGAASRSARACISSQEISPAAVGEWLSTAGKGRIEPPRGVAIICQVQSCRQTRRPPRLSYCVGAMAGALKSETGPSSDGS